MSFKRLYIWVEGPDDERFFNKIIKPIFLKKYDVIETITYAHLKKEKIQNFLKSIISMDADYIYVADINNSPCVMSKKAKMQMKVQNLDDARINIVIKEIESWYLAGLGDKESESFKISTFKTTDSIIKEQFNSIIPNQFAKSLP